MCDGNAASIAVPKPIRFNVHLFTQSSMEAGRAELWYIEGRQVSIQILVGARRVSSEHREDFLGGGK